MYRFNLVEKKLGKKSGARITLGESGITLWKDYLASRKNALYAKVYLDKEEKVVGLHLSQVKSKEAYRIYYHSIKLKISDTVPVGVYEFKETTKEDIDVFVKFPSKDDEPLTPKSI